MKMYNWFIILFLLFQQPIPAVSSSEQNLEQKQFITRFEPAPYLAVGDIISIEVTAPVGIDLSEHSVNLSLVYPISQELGSTTFFSSADQPFRARFPFVWDTAGLQSGQFILNYSIEPGLLEWKEVITLHEPESTQSEQHWAALELDCCVLHYITETRAERDLQFLASIAEEQVNQASEQLAAELPEPISIVFLPRVIGHGGFAGEELFVSYSDVNYTNIDLAVVLHHEIIHRLDRELGGPYRPAILTEGLAVYLSEGHFKKEDPVARSAALLNAGGYLPLTALADNFYPSQHESGYMLAGALVSYLVETYGWDAFSNFYRDIQPPDGGSDSSVINAALQEHFNLTFSEIEERFIGFLQTEPVESHVQTDVRLTIEFYDTLRMYQQHLDPGAYYRNVWLFPDAESRRRGIVEYWIRRPAYPQNQMIERILESAGEDLLNQNYVEVEKSLSIVRSMLDGIPHYLEMPYRPAFSLAIEN